MVRRLPVLQAQDPEDLEAEQRSPGGWVGVGAVLALTIWLPLLLVAQYVSAKLVLYAAETPSVTTATLVLFQIGPVLLSLCLATGSAGALVGRFGGRARAGHAALSGLAMALGAGVLSGIVGSFPSLTVALVGTAVLALVASGSAFLGGLYGVRRRPSLGGNAPQR